MAKRQISEKHLARLKINLEVIFPTRGDMIDTLLMDDATFKKWIDDQFKLVEKTPNFKGIQKRIEHHQSQSDDLSDMLAKSEPTPEPPPEKKGKQGK